MGRATSIDGNAVELLRRDAVVGPGGTAAAATKEPVLTVRQPWASAIFFAGKDVENRGRRTKFRGRLWIHAGVYVKRSEPDQWARENGLWLPEEPLPRGVILGCVELVDCVKDSDSPWAEAGSFHWLIRRPQLLREPVPMTGALGMQWREPPEGTLISARRVTP